MLFFWPFYSSKNPEKLNHFSLKNIKQHNIFNIVITIRNIYWAANRHIRMISEGSRDTDAWSNDAENSALNKIYFNRKHLFYIVIIFHNIYCFYCNFDQINAALVNKKIFGMVERVLTSLSLSLSLSLSPSLSLPLSLSLSLPPSLSLSLAQSPPLFSVGFVLLLTHSEGDVSGIPFH